jgi:hypothetical protein
MHASLPKLPRRDLPVPIAAVALAHSADARFPTWGEVEPGWLRQYCPTGRQKEFRPSRGGPRGSLREASGGRWLGQLRQPGILPNPYGFRHPQSTEHREVLLCLSV